MKVQTFFPEVCCRWLCFFQKTKFFKQLQFWVETIKQCHKIYQLDTSDWQRICKIIAPADSLAKDTTDFEINTSSFRQINQLIFDTLLQCVKLLSTPWEKQIFGVKK